MSDPRIPDDNDYPVDIPAPDISAYASGNTGVPYIWSFTAAEPGPHVAVTAVVHGNEPCGAVALDRFLQADVRPVCGTLTFGFMNIAAYEAFDPEHPNLTRWLDEDFNRLWDVETLKSLERPMTQELARAREVWPVIDTVDYLFDIHSMQHPCIPLMMAGWCDRGREFARAVGAPPTVVADHGHAAGRRMRDYQGFSDPASPKNALLVECGQHWAASSADWAVETAARFLIATGAVTPEFEADFLTTRPAPEPQAFYEVFERVTIETDDFRFAEDWLGFEHLKQGRLIAFDGDREIRAEHDPTVLVMPSKRLWPGLTAVRLAKPL